jgi:hypothetical protein
VFIQSGPRKSSSPSVLNCKSLWYIWYTSTRLDVLCTDAGGNHFQHLLWWYILSEFGYCINLCIYAMLRTRATFSWPILHYTDSQFINVFKKTTVNRHTFRYLAKSPLLYVYSVNMNSVLNCFTSKYCYILFRFIIDFTSEIIMKGTKVTVILLLQKRKVKLRYIQRKIWYKSCPCPFIVNLGSRWK